MEIKLPENPWLYLILIGFIFIIGDLISIYILGTIDWKNMILVIIGTTFIVWAIFELSKNHELKREKKREEIEFLKTKKMLKGETNEEYSKRMLRGNL